MERRSNASYPIFGSLGKSGEISLRLNRDPRFAQQQQLPVSIIENLRRNSEAVVEGIQGLVPISSGLPLAILGSPLRHLTQFSRALDHSAQANLSGVIPKEHSSRVCAPRFPRMLPNCK